MVKHERKHMFFCNCKSGGRGLGECRSDKDSPFGNGPAARNAERAEDGDTELF